MAKANVSVAEASLAKAKASTVQAQAAIEKAHRPEPSVWRDHPRLAYERRHRRGNYDQEELILAACRENKNAEREGKQNDDLEFAGNPTHGSTICQSLRPAEP